MVVLAGLVSRYVNTGFLLLNLFCRKAQDWLEPPHVLLGHCAL